MAKGKFNGMGNMGNMGSMLKQAQKMQADMERVQAELEEKVIEVSTGGGAVTISVTGKKVIKSIKINPDVVDKDDVEMLEDLLMVAFNDAFTKVDEMMESQMGKITGGINIPGLF